MSSNLKRGTYICPIDQHGDISDHVNSFIVSLESYARSIGQELGKEGMRQYYLHLDDAELARRHPTVIRKPKLFVDWKISYSAGKSSKLFDGWGILIHHC